MKDFKALMQVFLIAMLGLLYFGVFVKLVLQGPLFN